MALTPAQKQNARVIINVGRKLGAPRPVIRAALATSLTEANLINNPGGTSDSAGLFQQRPSMGWGSYGQVTNPKYASKKFYDTALPLFAKGTKGPALSQAVERSAFPGRYQPNFGPAGQILRGVGGLGAPQVAPPTVSQSQTSRTVAPLIPLANPLAPAVPTASPVLPSQRPGEFQRKKQSKAADSIAPLSTGGQITTTTTTTTPAPVATIQGGAVVQRVQSAAKALQQKHLPYTWGGGHSASGAPAPGLDCSGAVRWVLNQAGIKTPSMVSGDFMNWGKPGPGAVTIYASPTHVFMKIGNKFFGTSNTNRQGGAGYFPAGTNDTSTYTVRHLPNAGAKAMAAVGGAAKKQAKATHTVQVTNGVRTDVPIFSNRPILSDLAGAAPTASTSSGLEGKIRSLIR